ncbi:hypothetical protein PQX77_009944 [Marasmius sp. AFHP31]|nr:hypothetical protein PQX77_009944 [Marasmius sp. AFHP31]
MLNNPSNNFNNTINIDSIPENSLLLPPVLPTIFFTPTAAQISNPYCAPLLREEAVSFIETHSRLDGQSRDLVRALARSIGELQTIVDEKNEDIERIKRDAVVSKACAEVLKKLSDIHKGSHTEATAKISALEREVTSLNLQILEREADRRADKLMIAGLVRTKTALATKAWKGIVGNAAIVLPDIRDKVRRVRFEVLATSGQLATMDILPADNPIRSMVSRTLKAVDEAVRLLDQVDRASSEVNGNISEDSPENRAVRRSGARVGQVKSIRDVFNRIRSYDPSSSRFFKVNTSPIWNFLGSQGSAETGESSMMSVSGGDSGMSMSEVSDWRHSVAGNGVADGL